MSASETENLIQTGLQLAFVGECSFHQDILVKLYDERVICDRYFLIAAADKFIPYLTGHHVMFVV